MDCKLAMLCKSYQVGSILQWYYSASGRLLKKSKNHHILAAFQTISTKFGTLMHFYPLILTVPTVKNLNFKNPRPRRPPFWNIEKSRYLGHGWSDFDKMWHSDTVWPDWLFWPLKNCSLRPAITVWSWSPGGNGHRPSAKPPSRHCRPPRKTEIKREELVDIRLSGPKLRGPGAESLVLWLSPTLSYSVIKRTENRLP